MKSTSILQFIEDHEQSLLNEIIYWKEKAEYWQKQHDDLLRSSIKHGDEMFTLVIKGALNGAFSEKKK